MIRVVLDRAVIALIAIAVGAAAAVGIIMAAYFDANSRFSMGGPESPEEQQWLEAVFFLTYLLSPGVTAVFVAALIGLPLVIGARAAALRRAR